MSKVIEIDGEKFQTMDKSFIGWLTHFKYFRNKHMDFEDWFSYFYEETRNIIGIDSIFCCNNKYFKLSIKNSYFEEGFNPKDAAIDAFRKDRLN